MYIYIWQLDRSDGGSCNAALKYENLGVNTITSHVGAVKLKRDVGIQWSDNDIIGDSLEIPKFSKNNSCRLEKSVEIRVDGVEQVRNQNIIIKCFKWYLMMYNIIYQVINNYDSMVYIRFTENVPSGNNGCGV